MSTERRQGAGAPFLTRSLREKWEPSRERSHESNPRLRERIQYVFSLIWLFHSGNMFQLYVSYLRMANNSPAL